MDNTSKSFKFFMPASLVKADDGKDEGKFYISGLASTSHIDLQGESVDQKGLSFDYFLGKNGVFNNNHLPGPENIIGEPTEARITKDGFYVKGYLYTSKKCAQEWIEHFKALEHSKSKRKIGMSIEGKVTSKEGSTIKSCFITAIAITHCPVNTNTWAEIAKSLAGSEIVEGEEEEKALSAGGMGGVMVPESLDHEEKVTSYKSIAAVPAGTHLSQEAYVTILQLEKGWSKATAEAVVDAIFLDKNLGN